MGIENSITEVIAQEIHKHFDPIFNKLTKRIEDLEHENKRLTEENKLLQRMLSQSLLADKAIPKGE